MCWESFGNKQEGKGSEVRRNKCAHTRWIKTCNYLFLKLVIPAMKLISFFPSVCQTLVISLNCVPRVNSRTWKLNFSLFWVRFIALKEWTEETCRSGDGSGAGKTDSVQKLGVGIWDQYLTTAEQENLKHRERRVTSNPKHRKTTKLKGGWSIVTTWVTKLYHSQWRSWEG